MDKYDLYILFRGNRSQNATFDNIILPIAETNLIHTVECCNRLTTRESDVRFDPTEIIIYSYPRYTGNLHWFTMHSSTKLSHNIHGNGYDALNDAVSMADIVWLNSALSVCSIRHILSSLFHDCDFICFILHVTDLIKLGKLFGSVSLARRFSYFISPVVVSIVTFFFEIQCWNLG